MAITDIINIVINSSKVSTWQSVIDEYLIYFTNPDSPIKDANALFTYLGNDTRIFAQYNAFEQNKYSRADQSLIKFGTLIKVPKECLSREILPNAGNLSVDLKTVALDMPIEVLAQLQSKDYIQVQQLNTNTNAGNSFLGNAYRVCSQYTVWVYAKALGTGKGKMINVTPFVHNITTNVAVGGGNFGLTLAPISCEYDQADGWIVSDGTFNSFAFNGEINSLVRDSLVAQKEGQFKRKTMLFHHLIQPNDVIFIQFETLQSEVKIRDFDPNLMNSADFLFPGQSPAGRNWDMIGLIDTSSLTYDPSNTFSEININGRCLMKLLIDDGCYIYPLDYARGFDGRKGIAIQRVLSKELYFFKSFVDVSVGYLVNFVMNLLSNIAVTDDDSLFLGWGDRRSYRYDINPNDESTLTDTPFLDGKSTLQNGTISKTTSVTKNLSQGIWQIVKLALDENVASLRLVDTSITDYQGSLLNYISKVVQMPFCEFKGDTYGDQYYFQVWRPPFTQDAYLEAFDKTGKIEISGDFVQNESLDFDDADIYSWYRLRPSGSFIDKTVGDNYAAELTVWLEELAVLFGAKCMDVTTIYGQIFNTNTDSVTVESLLKQFRSDLIYIISTSVYLPFTRKGTITLNPGDRRIKRGMVIRYTDTGELFYVDAVTNTATQGTSSVERETILTVSRGMVEQYARAKAIPNSSLPYVNSTLKSQTVSYFNIVDYGLDITYNTENTSASNIKVNKDVLNFFLKRKQFVDDYVVGSADFTNGN